jgi:hypothetical protein
MAKTKPNMMGYFETPDKDYRRERERNLRDDAIRRQCGHTGITHKETPKQ